MEPIQTLIFSLSMVTASVAAMMTVDPINGRSYIPPLALTAFVIGIMVLVIGQG